MRSMTGFARLTGEVPGMGWAWEMRSVNARNLDLRLRLPEGAERLDPVLRKAMKGRVQRGSVTVGLRYTKLEEGGGETGTASLDRALGEVEVAEARAQARGLNLTPASAAEIVTLARTGAQTGPDYGWIDSAQAQIPELMEAFLAARQAEGDALSDVLAAALDQVNQLVKEAREVASGRTQRMADLLKARIAELVTAPLDEARLEHEVAALVVKADVTEELDRLDAHIVAAHALIEDPAAVGRRFDFLMQEFNREANTLASKSQDTDLTRIALALKVVIDQMREQVQNME